LIRPTSCSLNPELPVYVAASPGAPFSTPKLSGLEMTGHAIGM